MPLSKDCDVVITGMGVLSPIGLNIGELMTSLKTNQSGIHLWESALLKKGFPVGMISQDFNDQFTKLELPYLDRCSQMAILAARQAVTDAGLDSFAEYGQRAGLFYGSVKGAINTEEVLGRQIIMQEKIPNPFAVMAVMLNAPAAQISIRHKILGPVMTHSSACTSSGTAIGDAFRAIRDGYLDVALVGGADTPIANYMLGSWDVTRALAKPNVTDVCQSCRPFSINRTGLVLGEGAAFLMLESGEHARRRGAPCYASLAGYGIASDAYHIGSPHVEGQVSAIRAAIADASIFPQDIDYLNAHATATRGGDIVEANAIRCALGEATDLVPVSSTKSIHGHLLGAASALELMITTLAMTESFLPATAFLDEVDPKCQLNHIANHPVFNVPIEHALSFSSGLGGTNVALVISKHQEMPTKQFVTPTG